MNKIATIGVLSAGALFIFILDDLLYPRTSYCQRRSLSMHFMSSVYSRQCVTEARMFALNYFRWTFEKDCRFPTCLTLQDCSVAFSFIRFFIHRLRFKHSFLEHNSRIFLPNISLISTVFSLVPMVYLPSYVLHLGRLSNKEN